MKKNFWKNKKVFITGGTGSIGNSICNYFNQNKCNEIYASTTNLEKVNYFGNRSITKFIGQFKGCANKRFNFKWIQCKLCC